MPIDIVRTSASPCLTMTRALYDAIFAAHQGIATTLINNGFASKKGDYLDIASDGKISWRPQDRIIRDELNLFAPIDVDKQFEVHGRVRGKPAKTLAAFLGNVADYYTARDWEVFSNRFLAANAENEFRLELVSGEDIRTLYHENKHTRIKVVGPLRNSCMRYGRCQPFLSLYTDNPKQVQMLVEFDSEGDVAARALVWNLDRGETFMDRVYGDNKSIEVFRQYAKDNGWWSRAYNTYHNPQAVRIGDETKTRVMRVTLEHAPIDYYPWLDTLMYYAHEKKVLGNTIAAMKGRGPLVELRSADGGYNRLGRNW